DWVELQPGLDKNRFAIVGLGQAGIIALCAGGLFDDRLSSVAALGMPVTYISDTAYAPGTYMGLLAPGILRFADIPHLAALTATRKLILAEGLTPQGKKMNQKEMDQAFRFTRGMYRLHKEGGKLLVKESLKSKALAEAL